MPVRQRYATANSLKTTQFLTIDCNKLLMNKAYIKIPQKYNM